MEMTCNNQTEQFELLSNKSLEECLIQATNENNHTHDCECYDHDCQCGGWWDSPER